MHPESSPEIRHLGINEEVHNVKNLIETGLAGIQSISPDNDFYHLPFLLLSNGLERLCKVLLWFSYQAEGRAPYTQDLKKYGHQIDDVLAVVLKRCFTVKYKQREATQWDYIFLSQEPIWSRIIDILSAFGGVKNASRYHHLNLATGKQPGVSAQEAWEELELQILQEYSSLEVLGKSPEGVDEAYEIINLWVIKYLEFGVRGLCRLGTLPSSPLSDSNALRHIGPMRKFATLMDQNLGQTNYRSRIPLCP